MKKKEKRLFNFDIYFTHCNMNTEITHLRRNIIYKSRNSIVFDPINNPTFNNPQNIIGRNRNYFGPYFVYRFINYLMPLSDILGDAEFRKWECL